MSRPNKMAMNEGVTIAIILTLVFGAIFYYLYSRIGQSEKRVSLLENILLDMKVAFESSLIKREVLVEDVRQAPMPMPMPSPSYQSHSSSETVEPIESLPTVGELDVDTSAVPSVSAMESDVAVAASTSQQDEYDRMTNKELKEAAKAQKIKGYSTMTRKELQDALRVGFTESAGVDMAEGTMTLDA